MNILTRIPFPCAEAYLFSLCLCLTLCCTVCSSPAP